MRTANILQYLSHDGAMLHYRHWPAAQPSGRALVLFHRGHEHGGRLQHVVDELDMPGLDIFAWDARGHGLNEGPRGYAPNFGYFVRDAEQFRLHLQAEHGITAENTVVIAQSVGAVIAAAWVHDYAPRLRGLVLASPAFSVNLYVPLAVSGLRLLHALRGDFTVNSYVKSKLLTKDEARQVSYDTDPLITRPIAVNILLELYEVAARVVADAGAIRVPTMMLVSGKDYVVREAPQREFFDRLGAAKKTYHRLEGFYHDTLGEKDRERALAPLRTFVQEQFTQPLWDASDLRQAHRAGFTFAEFDQLRRPLPALSPKNLMFKATRAVLAGPGKCLSRAIRIGEETGYDSGSMLDCVYRNHPDGLGIAGRLADKTYLNAIGWRGIRLRREHIIEVLARVIGEVRQKGLPVRVVDIAAGHGRYVLDALKKAGFGGTDAALLRDYSDLNVVAGSKLIAEMGLPDNVRFENGDAFDGADLAALTPQPTVAVVSGLYELIPDNDKVTASLAGLGQSVAPGGYLVYTGQPWHPQLEFIARVLTSHRNGEDWVMRRRTQAEMDELVRAAGFEKVTTIADRWGIFTVSLAVKK